MSLYFSRVNPLCFSSQGDQYAGARGASYARVGATRLMALGLDISLLLAYRGGIA
jgi:hypothetical protein